MYDFCTAELQEKLKPAREVLKKQGDAVAEHAVRESFVSTADS
jgi:hypothetical protein